MVRPGDCGMSDEYSCGRCIAIISLLLAFPYDMFANLVYHLTSSPKKQSVYWEESFKKKKHAHQVEIKHLNHRLLLKPIFLLSHNHLAPLAGQQDTGDTCYSLCSIRWIKNDCRQNAYKSIQCQLDSCVFT